MSGVTFAVGAGEPLGVVVTRRLLDRSGLEIDADDEPDDLYEQVHGPGSAANRTRLFVDRDFFSEDAAQPVRFDHFTSGNLDATIRVDADARNDAKGNTAWAAAFHAIKFALLTHQAVVLLKGDDAGMPKHHQFHLVRETGGAFSQIYQFGGGPITRTRWHSSADWFDAPVVSHEYGHAIVYWLPGTMADQAHVDAYNKALGAMYQRFEDERKQRASWHAELVVTNGGYALSEGLTELIEHVLGLALSLPRGRRQTAPSGKAGWEQYRYDVHVPVAGQAASAYYRNPAYLSSRCGRNVEGVFAGALWEYLSDLTGLPALYRSADDKETGCKQPQAFFDDWRLSRANPPDALAQLRRLVTWLLVDPLQNVVGQAATWTGRWPDPGGDPYPTVYDFLKRIEQRDPGGANDPKEAFSKLHDDYLLPWNLEQDPAPGLGPDWTP